MKKLSLKTILLFFAVAFLFSACDVVKSLMQMNKKHVKMHKISNGKKMVYYIGMHHIGKQQFYDDVKYKVDSLKKNGYIVYFESISFNKNIDSLKLDTYRRKRRKLLGLTPTGTGYKDATAGTPLEKYVPQPDYEKLGLTKTDLRVDVPFDKLIDIYEANNGIIPLDSIDIHTHLDSAYKAPRYGSSKSLNYIIHDYRNEYIANYIDTSSHTKIVLVFGDAHRKGIFPLLKKRKTGWH